MNIRSEISHLAREMLGKTIEIRRYIHANPELSYQEFETSSYIRREIESTGITDIIQIAGTGLMAHIKGEAGTGKRVVLRAELDALPIMEKSTVSYISNKRGVMHACGHDAHMAMLVTVLKIFHKLKSRFKGDIYFLFQPGEELVPGGASMVLNENILQEIDPDAVIAQHVLPELETGKIGFRSGQYMASSDEIYIDINGIGGHAALPGASTDQVLIASELIVNLKSQVKSFSKDKPVVFGIGKFIADGATNVIPSNIHIEGTLRTFDENVRNHIHSIINRVCNEAEQEDVKVELEIRRGYPVLINDDSLTSHAVRVASELNGHNNIETLALRMSSEDFAYYSNHFPSLFYRIGSREKGKEQHYLHTSTFDIDEKAMLTGISTMCAIAFDILSEKK